MGNYKINALMIKSEDLEPLLAEWGNIPPWLKMHVSARYPFHRYEGQLSLQDGVLVFDGRDMKEGKDCTLDVRLDAVDEVRMGFYEEEGARVEFEFGTMGLEPIGIRYRDNGENHIVYIYTCPDNYQPHMLFHNRKWYQMLQNMTAGREAAKLATANAGCR